MKQYFGALALLFGLALGSSAHAQCSQFYDSSMPVPAGWGAAYDVFAPGSLLASVDCTTVPNVHLIVGAENAATQRIWHTAYLSQDGNTWSPVALSQASPANPLLADGYFQSQAIATLNLTFADLSNKWNYIAFLVAYRSGASWIYGCADTTCATPGWNLQAITVVPQLIVSFAPSAPSLLDNATLGTPVTNVSVTWSDGSPFTGTLTFGAPFSDDGGLCVLAGNQVTLGTAIPPGQSSQKCTFLATQ